MPWVLAFFVVLLTAQFTGSALLAQSAEPFLGEWAGKGAFTPVDADKPRPLACRYRGTAKGNEVLMRLRCATRQSARIFEMRLTYGEANRINSAEVVRPVARAGQRLEITHKAGGLTVSDPGGGRLEVRHIQGALRLNMTDPARGGSDVTLHRRSGH